MRVGMLWFDDSKERTLAEKIDRAVRHYQGKYSVAPNVCYVHPSVLIGRMVVVPGVEVKGTNMVLPNHFWIGRSEKPSPESA